MVFGGGKSDKLEEGNPKDDVHYVTKLKSLQKQ